MILLCTPDLAGNERQYLQDCIETTFVSSVGKFVTEFEKAVATEAGTAGGVATASGTTALHLALTTLRIGAGDLVLLPSYTFIASANAISMAGARPWLVDISADTWTLDRGALREALATCVSDVDGTLRHAETGERVAAIMPVHTLGNPANMGAIGAVAEDYGLPVIADAAAALGATYRGRAVGELAAMSCFSFNGNKTITCGGGGMVVSPDPALLERAAHLNTTARQGTDYIHDEAAFNYRMTNIQAAVGVAQIERLPSFLETKAAIRASYNESLADLPDIELFPEPQWDGTRSAYWFSGVLMPEAQQMPEMLRRLNADGIQARPFWLPMHIQPPYKDCPRAKAFPVSDDIAPRVLTLPCSTHLTTDQQAKVIERVRHHWPRAGSSEAESAGAGSNR